jgi:hypothetical protein
MLMKNFRYEVFSIFPVKNRFSRLKKQSFVTVTNGIVRVFHVFSDPFNPIKCCKYDSITLKSRPSPPNAIYSNLLTKMAALAPKTNVFPLELSKIESAELYKRTTFKVDPCNFGRFSLFVPMNPKDPPTPRFGSTKLYSGIRLREGEKEDFPTLQALDVLHTPPVVLLGVFHNTQWMDTQEPLLALLPYEALRNVFQAADEPEAAEEVAVVGKLWLQLLVLLAVLTMACYYLLAPKNLDGAATTLLPKLKLSTLSEFGCSVKLAEFSASFFGNLLVMLHGDKTGILRDLFSLIHKILNDQATADMLGDLAPPMKKIIKDGSSGVRRVEGEAEEVTLLREVINVENNRVLPSSTVVGNKEEKEEEEETKANDEEKEEEEAEEENDADVAVESDDNTIDETAIDSGEEGTEDPASAHSSSAQLKQQTKSNNKKKKKRGRGKNLVHYYLLLYVFHKCL